MSIPVSPEGNASISESKTKSLLDWRATIARETPRVDIAPYSHNIVSLALGVISREWGATEANRAIDDFNLASLGWHKEKEDAKE